MANLRNACELLGRLRVLMRDTHIVPVALDAYIVPSGDAHGSEYVAACDERRSFLTGFTGSAGTAVVTAHRAALWTDGRYFTQVSSSTHTFVLTSYICFHEKPFAPFSSPWRKKATFLPV